MFDADKVIAKVEEIQECENIRDNLIPLRYDYDITGITFTHKSKGSTKIVRIFETHPSNSLNDFIKDELKYYDTILAKLKLELKDL